jgi:hypothetical protein
MTIRELLVGETRDFEGDIDAVAAPMNWSI